MAQTWKRTPLQSFTGEHKENLLIRTSKVEDEAYEFHWAGLEAASASCVAHILQPP